MTLPTRQPAGSNARDDEGRTQSPRRTSFATRVAPNGVTAAGAAPASLSPQQLLAVQRSAGNAATSGVIAGLQQPSPEGRISRRGQARRAGPARPPVQRKVDDLTPRDLAATVGVELAAAITRLIDQYNATAPLGQLGGDVLKAQLEADELTIRGLEAQIAKAIPEELDLEEFERRSKDVNPLLVELDAQRKGIAEHAEEIRLAEQAAKPLKEKHLSGLLRGKETRYKELVGETAKDTAEVSDEALAEIMKLYSSRGEGRKVWQEENTRRERERSNLSGPQGWVTELLGPHAQDAHVRKALQLIGQVEKSEALSVKVMVAILNELHASPIAAATEVKDYFGRQVDKRAATDPDAAAKTLRTKRKAAGLRGDALKQLGEGKTWTELSSAIDAWWTELKANAAKDTFAAAFQAKTMTVRVVAKGGSAQGGKFKAQIPVGESNTTTGEAEMELKRDRGSILDRTKPQTWTAEQGDIAAKKITGLYELSASLLDPDRDSGIYPQLKFYSNPEAVVFMPSASPKDLQIFAAISELADANSAKLREIAAELTRITLAQSTDMGTKYVDKSPGNKGTDIRYGESGTIIRYSGGTGKAAREHEIEARRTNALRYTDILADNKHLVNEVVIEYRKHASGRFPLFTEIDHAQKRFYILDPTTFVRTGKYIDNKGIERPN